MGDVVGGMMSGAQGAKFERVGDEVEGVIVAIESRQDAVYGKPDQLIWWNRGPGPRANPEDRPKMVPVFTIKTAIRDSAEDDGNRQVWARSNMYKMIRDAIKKAFGAEKPSDDKVIGGTLKVRFNATTKTPNGTAKLYLAKFTRGSIVEDPNVDHGQQQNPDDIDPGSAAENEPPPGW